MKSRSVLEWKDFLRDDPGYYAIIKGDSVWKNVAYAKLLGLQDGEDLQLDELTRFVEDKLTLQEAIHRCQSTGHDQVLVNTVRTDARRFRMMHLFHRLKGGAILVNSDIAHEGEPIISAPISFFKPL